MQPLKTDNQNIHKLLAPAPMLAANCLTTGPTPAGASYEWGIAEVCTFVHTYVMSAYNMDLQGRLSSVGHLDCQIYVGPAKFR